jgi:hypothetical protein
MVLRSGRDIGDEESGLFVAAYEPVSSGQRAARLQLARNEADGRGGRWWQMLASTERRRAGGKLQDELNKVQQASGGRSS